MDIRHHKYGKPYKRKIVVGKDTWSWRILPPNIAIRSPNGKTTIHTNLYEINGTTESEWWDENTPIEPCSMYFSRYPAVTPKDVRRIIDQNASFL